MTLSVCMITYSQEKYIEKAILGILMQVCDFEIELVIADDYSPDNTNKIVKKIITTHPKGHCIKYTRHTKNLGLMHNFIFALQQCKGKYIALCEGDDYWTNPFKLQKQVDFLKNNPGTNICFHRANLLKKGVLSLHPIPKPFENKKFEYIELLRHYNFITTASVVFRKPESFKFPDWFYNISYGDIGLYKLVSRNKNISCINEVMSVYRIHDKGIYSALTQVEAEKKYLDFYKLIFHNLNINEKSVVKVKMKQRLLNISKLKYPKNLGLQKFHYVYNYLRY